jgi:hypothetical protein
MNGNLLLAMKALPSKESDFQGQAHEILENIPRTNTCVMQMNGYTCEKKMEEKFPSARIPIIQTIKQVPGQPILGITILQVARPRPTLTNMIVFSYKEVTLAPHGTLALM